MNIYEIDQAILNLVNPETGEIENFEEFEALNMARENKLEQLACWHKNMVAEAKAIREEEKNLAERRQRLEKRAERVKLYLSDTLQGEKFKTPKVAISYRKSEAVNLTDETALMADIYSKGLDETLLNTTIAISKTEVKKLLKSGTKFAGAELVEKNNINIK